MTLVRGGVNRSRVRAKAPAGSVATGERHISGAGRRSRLLLGAALTVIAVTIVTAGAAVADRLPQLIVFDDPSGSIATYATRDSVDMVGPFFQDLGKNGRTCASCHVPATDWSITPKEVQARFVATGGTDPMFRTNDGADAPTADVSTPMARRAAYSLLLTKALIRIGLPVPPNAEFELVAVDDPYHYASSRELSLYRRTLPATNLAFLSTVPWDGRSTTPGQSLSDDLAAQADSANRTHAQADVPLTAAQRRQIAAFEEGIFTAQRRDAEAGQLDAASADGGPVNLAHQSYYPGINDPFGRNPTGAPFQPQSMTLFGAWAGVGRESGGETAAARRTIARGEHIFDTKPITITGIAGLNDLTHQTSIVGTCTTCHDTPNVGNHSAALFVNTGVSDAARRTPDLPLYTLHCESGPLAGTTIQTTDPGRALITGRCADIGEFKVPILRGLPARPPYFHNGSAATLDAVVDFYDRRFRIGLASGEGADLVAFLRSL